MNPFDPILLAAMAALFGSCVFLALALVPPEGAAELEVHEESLLRRRRGRAQESPIVHLAMPLVRLVALRIASAGMDPGARQALALRLARAGYPAGLLPEEFVALQWVAALVTFAGTYGLTLALGSMLPVLALPMAFGAYFMPDLSLNGQIRERQWRVSIDIPYALDLITLTMEAGATFVEAVDQIVRDSAGSAFVQELAIMNSEIRLGTPRREALLALAQRIDIDWFHTVVAALLQGEELGVPISSILKNQSDVIRVKRTQRAEKIGEEAPVKMVMPTMMVMISVLLIFLGPAIVKWAKGDFAI